DLGLATDAAQRWDGMDVFTIRRSGGFDHAERQAHIRRGACAHHVAQILVARRSAIPAADRWCATERIMTGGEPFGRELSWQLQKLMPNTHVVDIYGLTETCSSDFFLFAHEREQFAGTSGRPAPGAHFRIADNKGGELPVAPTGKLKIGPPFIMNGYLAEGERTRSASADGFSRPGDLARRREDGRVDPAGRIKELIIR